MSDHKRICVCAALLYFTISTATHAVELNWVGCEVSKAAYIDDLARGFQQQTGHSIQLNLSDSTRGIHDVGKGESDLGSSTRYLLPGDPRESGVEIVPVAWDALTIIVHKDNAVTDISLEQLREIYSGRITNWSALGGADLKIDVFVDHYGNKPAGRSLRDLIFSDSKKKFRVGRLMNADNSLGELLAGNPAAIAITGISNARAHDVKIVSLDGIAPTIEAIKSGDYRLYRPLYLTYNPNSSNLDAIKDFISYMNSKDARELMRGNGVVPYTDAMGLVMKKVRENEATYPQAVGKL